VGFPIRRSPDRSLLAAPRGFSQRATSFVASRRQGIHQMPFSHSPRPSDNAAPFPARPEGFAGTPPGRGASQASRTRGGEMRRRRPPGAARTQRLAVAGPREETRGPRRIPMPDAAPATPRGGGRERRPPVSPAAGTVPAAGCTSTPHDFRENTTRRRRRGIGGPAPVARGAGPISLRRHGPGSGPPSPRGREGAGRPGLVGPGRLERPTSRLSGVRSNQLSYGPARPRAPRRGPGRSGRKGCADGAPAVDCEPSRRSEDRRAPARS
jgi:hypothetical protein